MATSDDPSYFGREQSLIKHIILKKYLERFAVITGSWCDGIVYVDGFSGPWNVQSDKLDDASFAIALRQLRNARETVRQRFKKDLQIKCIFLEKKPEPFAQHKRFAEAQTDADVKALN
jgi:three-Cys-motif partner protein